MSDLRYWLWLSSLRGLNPAAAARYLRAVGSPRDLFLARESTLRRVEGAAENEIQAICSSKDISRAEAIEENCRRQGIRILCLKDASYPERLRNIYDPPLVLYIKGVLPPVDDRLCIGVVGTRKATDYGMDTAARLAGELSAWDSVTVTGLADGIDSAAARGALKAGGKVTCGDVNGEVCTDNGSVVCGDVNGDVEAGGDISCGSVEGDVTAHGDFHCDGDIGGDVNRV